MFIYVVRYLFSNIFLVIFSLNYILKRFGRYIFINFWFFMFIEYGFVFKTLLCLGFFFLSTVFTPNYFWIV